MENGEHFPGLIYLSHTQLFREENGDPVSLMFELDGCGLKNMDMEFTQFMINVMKDYYPDPLNYIIVFEMPWVLNAAFKIIKVKVQFHPDFKGGHRNVFPSENFLCVCKSFKIFITIFWHWFETMKFAEESIHDNKFLMKGRVSSFIVDS